jgi:hypothetical protein
MTLTKVLSECFIESERARLLDALRGVNEDRERVCTAGILDVLVC